MEEYDEFAKYEEMNKIFENKPDQWKMSANQAEWKNDFKMTVHQQKDPRGGRDDIMRGHGTYRNVTAEEVCEFFVNGENLPGLLKWVDVETLPNGDEIKFYRVKAPLCSPRENVLKYKVDKREDGSIFISMRSWVHDDYPVNKQSIRAVYSNTTYIWPNTEDNTVELIEYI